MCNFSGPVRNCYKVANFKWQDKGRFHNLFFPLQMSKVSCRLKHWSFFQSTSAGTASSSGLGFFRNWRRGRGTAIIKKKRGKICMSWQRWNRVEEIYSSGSWFKILPKPQSQNRFSFVVLSHQFVDNIVSWFSDGYNISSTSGGSNRFSNSNMWGTSPRRVEWKPEQRISWFIQSLISPIFQLSWKKNWLTAMLQWQEKIAFMQWRNVCLSIVYSISAPFCGTSS